MHDIDLDTVGSDERAGPLGQTNGHIVEEVEILQKHAAQRQGQRAAPPFDSRGTVPRPS
ncbi:hypothetical protein Sviol_48390 [Streptomyces violascens]|uniref:Uncharacterized protein n=1 Tax=Streptomyces violascens TaxID=67381 RepID=A0ABQ3QT14_9ACTN|nr:hypothetical protein Sviol_48390 [Streptomyces violascens]